MSNNNKSLDVLIIGMGFSGICAAIKLIKSNITNIQIHEKSEGIGGTWQKIFTQEQRAMFRLIFIAIHSNQIQIGQDVMPTSRNKEIPRKLRK